MLQAVYMKIHEAFLKSKTPGRRRLLLGFIRWIWKEFKRSVVSQLHDTNSLQKCKPIVCARKSQTLVCAEFAHQLVCETQTISLRLLRIKGAFFSIFRDLQDYHTFAPLRPQNFSKCSLKNYQNFAKLFCKFSWNFCKFQSKSIIFRVDFDEILSEFQEIF